MYYQGVDQFGFSPDNLIAAVSLFTPSTRYHHLIQVNKKTGLYYDTLTRKINILAKGSTDSTTNFGVVYKSQAFVVDKTGYGVTPVVIRNMYYAMIDATTPGTDILHYASLVPATFAVNYEWDINLPAATTIVQLTVVADTNPTGNVYVYISSNLNSNSLYSFKKADGSKYLYMRYELMSNL